MAIVNLLLTTFPGLGLPPTFTLQMPSSATISELRAALLSHLPQTRTRFTITTTSNKVLSHSADSLSSLLGGHGRDLLPLRLSVPTRGGKGGFGSQLRAAGGRMSSKRQRAQGDGHGSSRNLDGRRLRTVTEAKALAEYLAVRPEMEKREADARRRRWQQVVDLAERRADDARNGAKGKLSGQWLEDKDEAGDRTRDAVAAAMQAGTFTDNLAPGSSNESGGDSEDSSPDGIPPPREAEADGNKEVTSPLPKAAQSGRGSVQPRKSFVGFDEDDDEFLSDESGDK